ncbi:class I adenylate-forming enzyme family protein [Alkalilimnicola ehrlichii MLHE-1]|uniref:AMP-dependent synthetase and ligase n=1 Tax=Alkalilimnicola ehrlichii (strain ATCC BAA-1101 / DSM 17681 / MLHE-1) TaxID=187272 RepID=Q0A8B2_ALKEH|nr:AMP-binding protein [Alkalilimnicola ehrlichii]ABI56925.1 AMP-dependent synthetase and ligase [Alkalilimnicola ehrlichii MLHE-1]
MSERNDYDSLPMNWVGDWAGRRAALTPDKPAVHDPDAGPPLTFAQMNARADRTGRWLTDTLGLAPGERFAVLCRNRLELVDLYLACGKTGVVLTPLSFRLAAPELNDLLARMAPSAFMHEEALAALAESLDLPPSVRRRLALDEAGEVWQRRVLTSPEQPANRPLPMQAPYLYIHTGGTTGKPKICPISHRQMTWNAIDILATSGGALGPQRELVTFPFFHIGGWNTLTPVYYAGGYSVLMREFDPGRALELIAAEGITHFGGVEAMLQLMSKHPAFADTDLSTLEGITTAGAPCGEATMRPWVERGIPVAQSYGLTEGGPSNFMLVTDGLEADGIWELRHSIGQSMFHTDYRITHPDEGTVVAPGETGVLELRSPHCFDGYLDDPDRTDRVFREGGWVWTGDMARADACGRVTLVGRADNVFVSGGENIAPEEIETVLNTHPGVSAAAVAGVPHPHWGQVPGALVVTNGSPPGVADLEAHAALRLARFKRPRHWRFVDALPLTGAGKIDRARVAEMLKQDENSDAGN